MTSLRLRSVELGSGRPKVCVPLVAANLAELASALTALRPADLDLVELRADCLAGSASDPSLVRDAIVAVRDGVGEAVPMLFTYRTTREGGEQAISADGYAALLETAVASGGVDAVDVEMMTPRPELGRLVDTARAHGVAVVVSHHDFRGTPGRKELVARLIAQQELGADVVKIAVMPTSARDVLTLLAATEEFVAEHAQVPVISMAMGPLGVVSRVSGETFGSCLSFGSVGRGSAPGQLEATDLKHILEVLHRS